MEYQDWEKYLKHEAEIVSRAGKASGKYMHTWNTTRSDGSSHVVDFKKVYCWSEKPSVNEVNAEDDDIDQENHIDMALLTAKQNKELEAKLVELDQWKAMGVYKEVEDNGQDCMSLRWVLKDKLNAAGETFCKARLCVRGFEEEQNFRTDSPTCSREGIRLFLAMTAAHKWKIHSLDVKGAFLQGKEIDRMVIIRPPKEAKTPKLWQLVKCAYGLADAPRCWYLRIREELLSLNAQPSKLDNGIFFFYEDDLLGLVILYVDDIMWSGIEAYMKPIITKLKLSFKISHEDDDSFSYVGLKIDQDDDYSICVSQNSYAQAIREIEIDVEKDTHSSLESEEITRLRGVLGQLNWLSNMTRPDISYGVSKLSANVLKSTVADSKEANKLVKYTKDSASQIKFPSLDLDSTQILVYTDASFNNLGDGGSQGGQIVFLKDKYGNACPISWRSNRVRRVARSTLAAETLSFADGTDAGEYAKQLVGEFHLNSMNSPVIMITDSKSLFDASNTTSLISDRRLRVEMSSIREMKEEGEIDIKWVKGEAQLADVLTKKGASSQQLMKVLKEGKIEA